jgi:hypothetical protein
MWVRTEIMRLNTVVPDIWIIEEELRRERERRDRKSRIPLELPISFPQSDEHLPEGADQKKHDKEEHLVIIDL